MAIIIGGLKPDHTRGEQQVLDALRTCLPDDYLVWPELPVQAEAERKHPDFTILHRMCGLVVLEVKDWRRILSANPSRISFIGRRGVEESEPNPVTRAKQYAETILRSIEETHGRAVSEGSFSGPLPNVCYAYGVVFTCQTQQEIVLLEQRLKAKKYLLYSEDLSKLALEARLRSLPRPGVELLNEESFELVRRAIYPDGDIHDRSGHYLGHLDTEQESRTKEGIYLPPEAELQQELRNSADEQLSLSPDWSPPHLSPDVERLELTDQGEDLVTRFRILLIRGVAGSGKTQILCKRAVLLRKLNPGWKILALTRNKGLAADLHYLLAPYDIRVANFERLCCEELGAEDVDLWRLPMKDHAQINWIRLVAKEVPGAEQFDPRFLREEFDWMKYTGRADRKTYLTRQREGREVRLDRGSARRTVYRVFELYEERLKRQRQLVWADVPLQMISAMEDGLIPTEVYDAILVDEAQLFPPSWFRVIERWLKRPNGMLFLAADMIQNPFSRFSWKQKGLDVRGRSRILRRSYRNSKRIALSAHYLVARDEHLRLLLQKDGDQLIAPEFDATITDTGKPPRLVACRTLGSELEYVTSEVQGLLHHPVHSVWPADIAVLCLSENCQRRFAVHLHEHGVPVIGDSHLRNEEGGCRVFVGLMAAVTGQEFRSVFVCDMQELFDTNSPYCSSSWEEFKAQQLRLLYIAMTRSRTDLHLCHRGNLPTPLQPLRDVTYPVQV